MFFQSKRFIYEVFARTIGCQNSTHVDISVPHFLGEFTMCPSIGLFVTCSAVGCMVCHICYLSFYWLHGWSYLLTSCYWMNG